MKPHPEAGGAGMNRWVAADVWRGWRVIALLVALQLGPEYQHYSMKCTFWAMGGLALVLRRVYRREVAEREQRRLRQRQAILGETHEHPDGQ